MKRASVYEAKRSAAEVLNFSFLVYEEAGRWIGRSVLTGHLSESASREGAILGLIRAIEACIEVARKEGQSPLAWLSEQRPDDLPYVLQFAEAVGRELPVRQERQSEAGVLLKMSVATGAREAA